MTLSSLPRTTMFKSFSNHYKNWKDKFVRVRGLNGTSMAMIRANDAPRFPIAWIDNPMEITRYDFEYLARDETGVVTLLDEFEVLSPRTMIICH